MDDFFYVLRIVGVGAGIVVVALGFELEHGHVGTLTLLASRQTLFRVFTTYLLLRSQEGLFKVSAVSGKHLFVHTPDVAATPNLEVCFAELT